MEGLESEVEFSRTAEYSLSRAAAVGELAATAIHELLDPYVEAGTQLPWQVKAIAKDKRDEAAAKYLDEIIAGKHNERASRGPGLNAIVTKHVIRRARGIITPPLTSAMYAKFESAETPEEPLYTMRLNTGWFEELGAEAFPTALSFYYEANSSNPSAQPGHRLFGRRAGFSVSIFNVIRIEGDNGEFWQNQFRSFGGSLKDLD